MKFFAAVSVSSAVVAASPATVHQRRAEPFTVEVTDFIVNKVQYPLDTDPRVKGLSFIVNGPNAENVSCHVEPPTWPINLLPCEHSKWRFYLGQGTEGSGQDFSISLYYDDEPAETYQKGYKDAPAYCTLDAPDDTYKYTCTQLIPISVTLEDIWQ